MFTLFVLMEFNFYINTKVLLLYMYYGYIDKARTTIRKQCHENHNKVVLGVCP